MTNTRETTHIMGENTIKRFPFSLTEGNKFLFAFHMKIFKNPNDTL